LYREGSTTKKRDIHKVRIMQVPSKLYHNLWNNYEKNSAAAYSPSLSCAIDAVCHSHF